LERNEQGQSPPAIARADLYDQRTVRKYLEIAKQERETKEARGAVLRSALERHYADLCRYAERLGGRASGGYGDEFDERISPGARYEPQLETALREHLPRSPIWGYLNRIEKLTANRDELTRQLRSTIEAGISSDQELESQITDEETDLLPGLNGALKAQAEWGTQGMPDQNVTDNLKQVPADDGFVNVYYGSVNMGRIRKEHVELVRRVLVDWTARIKQLEEYRSLEKTVRELDRVGEKLRGEIAVIVLRRVLPGRCRYCPL